MFKWSYLQHCWSQTHISLQYFPSVDKCDKYCDRTTPLHIALLSDIAHPPSLVSYNSGCQPHTSCRCHICKSRNILLPLSTGSLRTHQRRCLLCSIKPALGICIETSLIAIKSEKEIHSLPGLILHSYTWTRNVPSLQNVFEIFFLVKASSPRKTMRYEGAEPLLIRHHPNTERKQVSHFDP